MKCFSPLSARVRVRMAKSANRMEDRAASFVLARRLYVACDNIRPRYLINDGFCVYESVGGKCEEGQAQRRSLRSINELMSAGTQRTRSPRHHTVMTNPTWHYPEIVAFFIGPKLHTSATPTLARTGDDERNWETRDGQVRPACSLFPPISFHQALFATSRCG